MGDYFERIIDLEVPLQDAGPLADRMVDWLVAEGVLLRETSGDGVYSLGVDEGHLPGPNWERAVHGTPGTTWPPAAMAVIVARDDHLGGQGESEADSATCPRCGTRTVIIDYPESFEADEEAWRPFSEAIDRWKETGEADAPCPACQTSSPVTEWDFGDNFDLGALAFDFWGWPPLADAFYEEFTRRLGHRTARQSGKF
ncbi:hypothetical protein GCM10023085_73380 [Actinomadura viridis]|uniref:RNA polymerase subunit RPABC4/transcription elongation factor Spt4 n=1 Tax=Actinomadura viridis TaxID=58110 RepID=A0A931DQH1_9ACTN|nr:hypothetical protein [Actinomadura viridis]MBG6092904.1 RNA polymerase subunit RPABC4/transcription elongation factor Spt4 [Actinomadura viridis]